MGAKHEQRTTAEKGLLLNAIKNVHGIRHKALNHTIRMEYINKINTIIVVMMPRVEKPQIKPAQENLGHHTANFTLDTYAHVSSGMKRESAKRMDSFIQSLA